MDKVLFIDAHNAIWRASIIFGGKPKSIPAPPGYDEWSESNKEVKQEEPQDDSVIITFNFFRNLRPLIEMFSPDKCFFVLEGHPQFRYDLFSDYKANRIVKLAAKKESVDKFQKAKDIILPIMNLLPITTCRAAKYEADDVIASLCDNMREEDLTVLSNDSDYIQLLQRGYSSCRIYNPIKKEEMASPAYPYVAWKCLNGDKSDNIPALLKPKKALDCVTNPKLFKEFLDVPENRANFNVNRQLIEFGAVAEEEIDIVEGVKDYKTLREIFTDLKFESIVNDKSWDKYCRTFDCLKY